MTAGSAGTSPLIANRTSIGRSELDLVTQTSTGPTSTAPSTTTSTRTTPHPDSYANINIDIDIDIAHDDFGLEHDLDACFGQLAGCRHHGRPGRNSSDRIHRPIDHHRIEHDDRRKADHLVPGNKGAQCGYSKLADPEQLLFQRALRGQQCEPSAH